jgi:hypothetical protein
MILHSKLGFGEIAHFKNRAGADELVEVIQINFLGTNVYYIVRMVTGRLEQFEESELTGDPDFDQSTGYGSED